MFMYQYYNNNNNNNNNNKPFRKKSDVRHPMYLKGLEKTGIIHFGTLFREKKKHYVFPFLVFESSICSLSCVPDNSFTPIYLST